MSTTTWDLARFIAAQDGGTSSSPDLTAYQAALNELRAGRKEGHWIWFVFPQGPFGTSERSRLYAITHPTEALAYLRHAVLGPRLFDATRIVRDQLAAGVAPDDLMGSWIDCTKLVSSMTLFEAAGEGEAQIEFAELADDTLSLMSAAGWGRCERTLQWLKDVDARDDTTGGSR